MADNTKQLEAIVYLFINLKVLFKDTERIFIAADHFWYPVEGDIYTKIAPDVMVAFDRPRGHRRSYKQWKEDGIAPHVVIEVLSPSNTVQEMLDKRKFYEKYGAEEFIIIDPETDTFSVFVRDDKGLSEVELKGNSWDSPRLKIKLLSTSDGVKGLYPDGSPFETPEQMKEEAGLLRNELLQERAETERQKEEAERQKAEAERQKAEAEKQRQLKDLEQKAKEDALNEVERLKAELKRLKGE